MTLTRRSTRLNMRLIILTVVKQIILTSPTWGAVIIALSIFSIGSTEILLITVFAVGSLTFAVGVGRIFSSNSIFVQWPRVHSAVDIFTSGLIFNWILIVTILLILFSGEFVANLLFRLGLTILLPIWLLRHVVHLFELLRIE